MLLLTLLQASGSLSADSNFNAAVPPEVAVPLQARLQRKEISQVQYAQFTQGVLDAVRVFDGASDATAPGNMRRRAQAVVPAPAPDLKTGWTNKLLQSDGSAEPLKTLPDGSSLLPMTAPGMTTCLGVGGLRDTYFSDPDGTDSKVRCFIYDGVSGTWPGSDDLLPNNLFDALNTRLDWHTLLAPSDATSPLTFLVGGGAVCTNVTTAHDEEFDGAALSEDLNMTETTTACIFAGLHESNHSHLVVAGAEEQFEPISGGQFVIGSCTDFLIRVDTASVAPGHDVEWTLDDMGVNGGSHMGPWSHTNAGSPGVHEYVTCLYDNNFTLTRTSSATDGWVGTVSVLGYVPDNSIHIPRDEKWIIQGGVDAGGLPIELDARLASGDPFALTNASIILRYLRFSGQIGPLDVFMTGGPRDASRPFSQRPNARMGE